MKTLVVWEICRTEAPIFAVFADQPLLEKEFVVDGLLAQIGIGNVFPVCSSPFATGLPVLLCTGIPPVAL